MSVRCFQSYAASILRKPGVHYTCLSLQAGKSGKSADDYYRRIAPGMLSLPLHPYLLAAASGRHFDLKEGRVAPSVGNILRRGFLVREGTLELFRSDKEAARTV